MAHTLAEAQDEVAALVQQYRTNLNAYRAPGYKEAHARQHLIDPLLIALGWDVHIDFTNAADKAAHDRMVKLVDTMLQLYPRLAAAQAAHDRDLIQRQIDATDKQIDALMYRLYGLTDDEIKIVEGR
jgi:hypothetical protein